MTFLLSARQRHLRLAAAALLVSGCSELAHNATLGPTLDLSQPNYRRIVADSLNVIFPKEPRPGTFEISGVRLVDYLKGPAWLTCLKIELQGVPQLYAIFIQNDKVVDSREGVIMDGCSREAYEPFTPAAK